MSFYRERSYNPHQLLLYAEIKALGAPETYAKDQAQIAHWLRTLNHIDYDKLEASLERKADLKLLEDKESVENRMLTTEIRAQSLRRHLEQLSEVMELFHLIATHRACMFDPPKDELGIPLADTSVSIQNVKPFNYLLLIFLNKQTQEQGIKTLENSLIIERKYVPESGHIKANVLMKLKSGNLSHLGREELVLERAAMLMLARQLATMLEDQPEQAEALANLQQLLNQKRFDVDLKNIGRLSIN